MIILKINKKKLCTSVQATSFKYTFWKEERKFMKAKFVFVKMSLATKRANDIPLHFSAQDQWPGIFLSRLLVPKN